MYSPGISTIEQQRPLSWVQRGMIIAREKVTLANLIGLLGASFALGCLLGIHPEPWNFRIPLYTVVVLWTLLRPRAALYLLPFAIPWGSLDTFSAGGTGYDADMLVALLVAGWLLGFVLQPFVARNNRAIGVLDREAFSAPRSVVLTMLVLLLTMLLSTIGAFSISTSLKEIAKWLEVLTILVVGTQYLRTRRQIWTLVILICIAALTEAGLGFAQEFLTIGPSAFVRDASLRVYGTFGQPNPYAGYINMTLALALGLLLLGRNLTTRLLAACTVLPLACVEYFTQSKGGWIAIAVAVIVILVVGIPQLRAVLALLGIAVLSVIGAYLAGKIPASLIDPILTKIGVIDISFTQPTTANYANSERVAHWVAGIDMFRDNPFFGVGMGNYQYAYLHYTQGVFVIPLGHAHNFYINIAAEAGIFGFCAFIFFLIAFFVAAGRAYSSINQRYQTVKRQLTHPYPSQETIHARRVRIRQFGILVNDRALAIGLLAALISVCVHNLVDNLYVHGMASLFALLFVLLIRLDRVT